MIQKIKNFFSGLTGIIMLLLTGTVGVLAYILSNKRKQINALSAKIDLVETQKQADLIEVEIKERMANKDALSHEIKDLKTALDDLDAKREQLAAKEQNKTDLEIEDFWKK